MSKLHKVVVTCIVILFLTVSIVVILRDRYKSEKELAVADSLEVTAEIGDNSQSSEIRLPNIIVPVPNRSKWNKKEWVKYVSEDFRNIYEVPVKYRAGLLVDAQRQAFDYVVEESKNKFDSSFYGDFDSWPKELKTRKICRLVVHMDSYGIVYCPPDKIEKWMIGKALEEYGSVEQVTSYIAALNTYRSFK